MLHGSRSSRPRALQYSGNVKLRCGTATLVAHPNDLRLIDAGICSQKLIGEPKIRRSTLRCFRCAATDRPYGPAPTMATSVERKGISSSALQRDHPHECAR